MKLQSFINGFSAGIITGILFAPASGKETRRRFSKQMADWANSLRKARDDAKENAEEELNELKKEEQEEVREIYHEIKIEK